MRNGLDTRNPKANSKVYSLYTEGSIVSLLRNLKTTCKKPSREKSGYISSILYQALDTKHNIEHEFKGRFKFPTDMAVSVGLGPEKFRTTKYWSPSTDCESYYRRSVAILVMDNLINNLEDRTADRKRKDGQIQP